MVKLEDLARGAVVKGILPDVSVSVIDISWHGSSAATITYKDPSGKVGQEILLREKESQLELVTVGQPWSFDADGHMLKLASEAHRIRLAYLFDPLLAVHTSLVQPLPHQITAVYEEMLSRQPLRFLLADDPGAGKTVMAGLLIKELIARGDLKRCMIVCPGSLVEQWQDELSSKFSLPFEILTNDKLESARTGNWFQENDLIICRLDKLSRNPELHDKLRITDWDLIVCDEAHKMSATYFGGEVKYTKRYHLGQLLSEISRNFLLMTATPHNGKDIDFQLFLGLLDGDRFEGVFREGVHTIDPSDLMRRLIKEQLVKFDGTPLFPERIAYSVNYKLSLLEAELYSNVTEYVRNEFNRVAALENDGRKGTVGFALTILQRRLASSPEAIYQSLKRRRERLETRLEETKLAARGAESALSRFGPTLSEDDIEDLEDAPEDEVAAQEELVLDQATASKTVAELQIEIGILKQLEELAQQVVRSGTDKKWDQLSKLLTEEKNMYDSTGARRKMIIFTEHRDTLNYLYRKITTLFGNEDEVITIHGGSAREDRKNSENRFRNDPDVKVLIATDAAGEGVNLQRAHLMINYDLPWNPNRLEQRFGRIHRIGQTEVCHLWNLIAAETREGEVYRLLLEKIEQARSALSGQVFDVLGKLTFEDKTLKQLLIEAIMYGEQPEVRERLSQVIDKSVNREKLQALIEDKAIGHETMDSVKVNAIREQMERAEARRLQPHFVEAFFLEAFKILGGTLQEREPRRYQVTNVPSVIRGFDRIIGKGNAVLQKYERIVFEKDLISPQGKAQAEFICPGHPLLDATIYAVLQRNRELLKQGAVLVDPNDNSTKPRLLVYLEQAIQDGRTDTSGNRRIVSRQLQFLEGDIEKSSDGNGEVKEFKNAGYAPFLDYEPLSENHRTTLSKYLDDEIKSLNSPEDQAIAYAIEHLVPNQFKEVQNRLNIRLEKTLKAVRNRLRKEIDFWDLRAEELKLQEQAGKTNAKLNSQKARQRADNLSVRLKNRELEIQQEMQVSPLPPVVVGGAFVIPKGLIDKLEGAGSDPNTFGKDRARIEQLAMDAVFAKERELGRVPRDVSAEKCGYDIESKDQNGDLYFIEVKGRIEGADTITVTKNEIMTALNQPERYILAYVEVGVTGDSNVVYIQNAFRQEPDFGVTSVNFKISDLISRNKNL